MRKKLKTVTSINKGIAQKSNFAPCLNAYTFSRKSRSVTFFTELAMTPYKTINHNHDTCSAGKT